MIINKVKQIFRSIWKFITRKKLSKTEVICETRKLKYNWTDEMEQDIKKMFNL